MNKEEQTVFIKDGNLVFTLPNRETKVISLERIEELMEWDLSERMNEVILSLAMIGNYFVTRHIHLGNSVLNEVHTMLPNSDTIYSLGLIAETFKH